VTDLSTISNDHLDLVYSQLLSWCRARDFAGHDPFDALNSRLFQASPFSSSRNARLAFTQILKRSPADFRKLARVPPQRNAKGIALFALAHLADYRSTRTIESERAARLLLADLREMKLKNYAGSSWGYNFDWQSRNFFAPRGTATIVPTAFAGGAFIEAGHAFNDESYFQEARSICDFIVADLPRPVDTTTEVCFSYAPETSTQIFNASLLAAEVLADVGAITKEENLSDLAQRATRFVINRQRPDGSWSYGTDPSQSWIDNFHTAYVLFSLDRIIKSVPSASEFRPALSLGYEFWKDSFFLADGWPKYYHRQPYPVDVHAGASAIVTFLELTGLDSSAAASAEKVAKWLITNMRDEQGFFYYQRRRFYTVQKPYMRWTQAWTLYALARLRERRAIQS